MAIGRRCYVAAMKIPSAASAFRARPMSALAMLFVVLALGHAVLVGCGGGGSSQSSTPTPEPSTNDPEGGNTTQTGTTPVALDGAAIYSQRCALCHGAEGKGDGPAAASLNPKPRNHTDGAYMNTLTDEAVLLVIHEGKGAMPAWKGVLSEEEIQAVFKHVRSLAVPPYPG
jgi:cytochrome c5